MTAEMKNLWKSSWRALGRICDSIGDLPDRDSIDEPQKNAKSASRRKTPFPNDRRRPEQTIEKKEEDVFYLSSIRALLERFRIDADSTGAFTTLCFAVENEAKTSFLQRLGNCETREALLRVYNEQLTPPKFEITNERYGRSFSNAFIVEQLKAFGVERAGLSPEQNVETLLKMSFNKGNNWVKDLLKGRMESLSVLDPNGEVAKNSFETLIQDIRIYEKAYR